MSSNDFCISDYNLRNGRRKSPNNFDQLKDEITRMQRAKAKLLELGYKIGGGVGYQERNEISMHNLCEECDVLKQDYKNKKEWKEVIEPLAYETAKKKWKKVKLYGKKIGDAASRIITFCVKQYGKINIKTMQEATPETLTISARTSTTGWSKRYISWNFDNEKTLFKKKFISIVEGKYENGKPLRSSADVPIPDDIVCEVIKSWENKHYLERKQLLHADIWNREKKFDHVRTELLLKLAPNSTLTLCWAIPICVLEKSLVRKRREEVKKEAMNFYHEAKRKALKQYEHQSRVEDALVVYWWHRGKQNNAGLNLYNDYVSDTLRGFPPDNFNKMMVDYKEHVQNLYDEANNDNDGYGDGQRELYNWQHWQALIRTDLDSLMENQQKQDEEEEWREEEIARLEELQERMRDYGSD